MLLNIKNLVTLFIISILSTISFAFDANENKIILPASNEIIYAKIKSDNAEAHYRLTIWEYKPLADTDISTYSIIEERTGNTESVIEVELGNSENLNGKLLGIEMESFDKHKVIVEIFSGEQKIAEYKSVPHNSVHVGMKYFKFKFKNSNLQK